MNYAPLIAAARGTCMEREVGQVIRSATRRWKPDTEWVERHDLPSDSLERAASKEIRDGIIQLIEERLSMVRMRLPPVCKDPPFPELDAQTVQELEKLHEAVGNLFKESGA